MIHVHTMVQLTHQAAMHLMVTQLAQARHAANFASPSQKCIPNSTHQNRPISQAKLHEAKIWVQAQEMGR